MSVIRFEEVESTPITIGEGVTRKMLISPVEGPHFSMRAFRIEARGSFPLHTNLIEHEEFVLSGRAKLTIGDETYEVSKGSAVIIPANVPHAYATLGEEAFEFLDLVPNQPDEIFITN
jgi:quercetin dioxygenase-like cupin family protein